MVAATLRWLFASESDDERENTWGDFFYEHRKVLELLIIVPVIALIVSFDFRHLPQSVHNLISECTAYIIDYVIYLIRWPLIIVTVLGVFWVIKVEYFDIDDIINDHKTIIPNHFSFRTNIPSVIVLLVATMLLFFCIDYQLGISTLPNFAKCANYNEQKSPQ